MRISKENPYKHPYPKFSLRMTLSSPYLCLMHFSKAKIMALKSTVHNEIRTPPSILPLMEGGGSELGDNAGADLNGSERSA
jgi:hypothetical protein